MVAMSDPVDNPTPSTESKETDWKAEARKWEQRSKENKDSLDAVTRERDDALAKVTGLESSNTELTNKVTAFESAQTHAALLAKVSEATGVDAQALRGSTEEELTEHAEYLKGLLDSRPSAPVIEAQGKSPEKNSESPEVEAVRSLFGKE